MPHHVRKLAAEAHQYQEIITVKLLYLGKLLHAVAKKAVTPHEFIASHYIGNRDAYAVQHGLYLFRAVAHAIEDYLLIRLPEVIPQAGIYLIKEKCHCMPFSALHHADLFRFTDALHECLRYL